MVGSWCPSCTAPRPTASLWEWCAAFTWLPWMPTATLTPMSKCRQSSSGFVNAWLVTWLDFFCVQTLDAWNLTWERRASAKHRSRRGPLIQSLMRFVSKKDKCPLYWLRDFEKTSPWTAVDVLNNVVGLSIMNECLNNPSGIQPRHQTQWVG